MIVTHTKNKNTDDVVSIQAMQNNKSKNGGGLNDLEVYCDN